jgi:hypothetical protein
MPAVVGLPTIVITNAPGTFPPIITKVTPSDLSAGISVLVTIEGHLLSGTISVTLAGVAATSVSNISDSKITCMSGLYP